LGDRFHVWSFWDERYLGMAITIRLNDGGARSGRLIIHSRNALSAERSEGCEVQAVRESATGIWSVDVAERRRGQLQTIQLKVAS